MPAHEELVDLDAHDGLLDEMNMDGPEHGAAPPANGAAGVNAPKIRVVVRSRPLNSKEKEKKDDNIIEVVPDKGEVCVDKEVTNVDMTKKMEKHRFVFDDALGADVDNDLLYTLTVQPLIETIFRKGKSTCFAYGQTGSGKTYTMAPLPPRAAVDILNILQQPEFSNLALTLSCFEIYGNKVFDLLTKNKVKDLPVREDANKKINVVNLYEEVVEDAGSVQRLIQRAALARETGATGANQESSRSHCIMQFSLKRLDNSNEVGRLSFIDLAGSERGADTFGNDKMTRKEGAEINQSLLSLKECIRALDSAQQHVPFRGSKLTEVLRDSFVAKEARTVMIANISPNASSVEHTLNTLRYADRVKELRKEKNQRSPGGVTPGANNTAYNAAVVRSDTVAAPRPLLPPAHMQSAAQVQPSAPTAQASTAPAARQPFTQVREQDSSQHAPFAGSTAPAAVAPAPQPVGASAPPAVNTASQRYANGSPYSDAENDQQQSARQDEQAAFDAEDELISAHRKEIEVSMAAVRREMGLLSQVDQPEALFDTYVTELRGVLNEKLTAIKALQDKLDAFSRKRNGQHLEVQSRVGSAR